MTTNNFKKSINIFYIIFSCLITLILRIKNDNRFVLALIGIAFIYVPIIMEKLFSRLSNFAYFEILGFIIISYQIGVCLHFYKYIFWFDLFVHGLSGIVFTRIGVFIYKSIIKTCSLFSLFFSLCFSLTLALVWEIYEYLGFALFSIDSQDILVSGMKDTMGDVIICCICTIITLLFYAIKMHRNKAVHTS